MKTDTNQTADKYGVTQDMIDNWKLQHGGVALIEVPEYDAHFYAREAERKDVSQAIANSANDALKYGETLCVNLWLGGDELFKSTEAKKFKYPRAAAPKIAEWAQAAEATLKKL